MRVCGMTNEPRPHDHLNLTRSAHHDKHSQKPLRLKNSAVPDQNIPYTPWVAVAARSPTDESDQEMDITQVWDHSWKFTADTEPCMQLWFDPAQGSPNDAVARIWAEWVVAAGARALPRGWWPRPWRQRPAPDPVALCRAQSAD
ncbi:Folate receptor alpha [Amphibalanus amphitrite]|uniref:Folate receptor alpha n=1 Tax=Amphibalanus amphitrite TaxID=1232801 RepID=A0A6A4VK54_AMPAM|nr:Folate receptor alpha [Amphibalanus amphitrite]